MELIGFLDNFRWFTIGGFGLLIGLIAGLYIRRDWSDRNYAILTVTNTLFQLAGFCSISLLIMSLTNGAGPLALGLVFKVLMGYVIYFVAVSMSVLLLNLEEGVES